MTVTCKKLADELWPSSETSKVDEDDDVDKADEEDIEKAVLREVERMKRPRKEKWFGIVL